MFTTLKAFQRLKECAEDPIDLTQALSSDRIAKMSLHTDFFDFLYAGERVGDRELTELFALAEETQSLQKMRSMQEGEIMNRIDTVECEHRAVLHTAMRDIFSDRQITPSAKSAADAAEKELKKLETFLHSAQERFTDCVQIGIGGSDLGPRALYLALKAYAKKGKRAHFISNVDPDDAFEVLEGLDLKHTMVVVVSKSGTTLETLTNEQLVRSVFEAQGLNPQKHFVAVTGEKSPMDNPSSYAECFYIWDFVGGRYSATSMVGAVTLGFCLGIDLFLEVLKGAHAMDVHVREQPPAKNLSLLSALLGIWNHNFLKYPTVAILPYSQALIRFPAHLQQLDMESNGKSIDQKAQSCRFSTGPIVWGEPGTNGQHSFYQLIHQGTDIVPVELIGFLESQRGKDIEVDGTNCQQKLLANLFAQSIALSQGQNASNPNKYFSGNRPNRILLGKKLTPFTMGALLAFYEHKVAFQGFIWGINSFDQEGVQLGKRLAHQMLDLFASRARFDLGEAYLKACQT